MKNINKNELFELRDFLILRSTQSVSQLGSSITAFGLALWLYGKTGSSLSTAIVSFIVAFTALLFFINIPENKSNTGESVLNLAKEGLGFLKESPLIMSLILFMSGVNLAASAFDAVLP